MFNIIYLQALKAEFEQHESLLRDLERQVEDYRAQGKTEAADRLEQQISILKVRHQAADTLEKQISILKVRQRLLKCLNSRSLY